MTDHPEYKDMFVSEAQEYVDTLNQGLLRLEKNREDAEAIHILFRAAHTLKGMAATMGFEGITGLCHEMENGLDAIRSGKMGLSPALIDILFECVDELPKLIGEVAAGNEQVTPTRDIADRLRRLTAGQQEAPAAQGAAKQPVPAQVKAGSQAQAGLPDDPAASQAVRAAAAAGDKVFHIKVEIDRNCAFRGVRAFLVVKNLEKMGKVLGTRPGGKALETGDFQSVFEVWLGSAAAVEDIGATCTKVIEIVEATVTQVFVDAASAGVSAVSTPAPAAPVSPAAPVAPAAPAAAAGRPAEKRPASARKEEVKPIQQTLRIPVERLDKIMNMVGELVTYKIRLAQIAKEKGVRELSDSLIQVEQTINELQQEVMAARMVPMNQIFNRFPRMVRDLAKELNKEVELLMEGGDIELDRTILDEITDPLVHLLRNAVDHGIETPQQRKALGKPPQAVIQLLARRQKNQVMLTVADNGHGIDVEKVRMAAVKKGFMTSEELSNLSEEETVNLIRLPGFSTMESVTSVSGRGVGVDAVATKLESLGGTMRIETVKYQGTRFHLRLPLTLAIIQGLLVRVGKERYIAPVASVLEAVEYTSSQLKRLHGQEILMLRDEVLPVMRLNQLLEVPGTTGEVPPVFTVLVVEVGERRMGLVVDEVIGQLEIAIKSLGRFLKSIRGFGGVTILGDGSLCLILDMPSLMELQ